MAMAEDVERTLVLGGRSKIGSALIRDLLEQGRPVTALIRGGEKASGFPEGVEVVVGDLADRDSLERAMRGVAKGFLLSRPHADAGRWHSNAISAAKEAGVGLLVRSSIIGADRDSDAEFIQAHVESDRELAASGVPYAIVRPNLFFQNIAESTLPSVDGGGRFYVNAGAARISMVDTDDVAAVARVLLTEPGHEGEAHAVTGPAPVSYQDVASALGDRLGRSITYVDVPDDAVRQSLLGLGLSSWFADALVGLYQDYRRSGADGYAAQVTNTVQRLTGRPPRGLAAYVAGLNT
jgi:uncharacterized protein YbjT (DUF2867 family)